MGTEAFRTGSASDLDLRLEVHAYGALLSTDNSYPKVYTPKLLFNARYKNFRFDATKMRQRYSNVSSSMINYDMTKIVSTLDTIGITSAVIPSPNDFKVNDGSLPFGRSFQNIHHGHQDGNKLDIRPFGSTVLGGSYDSINAINPTTPPQAHLLFNPNSKYDDVAILMGASHVSSIVNAAAASPLPIESSCHDTATNCLPILTVEKCLFKVETPVPGSTCAAMHAAVSLGGVEPLSMAKVRSANSNLATWVMRNQEALSALKAALPSLHLQPVTILYSNGDSPASKAALAYRANLKTQPIYSVPYNATTFVSSQNAIPKNWNFQILFRGAIPSITINAGTPNKKSDPELFLLQSSNEVVQKINDLESIFSRDFGSGHLNHFHISIRSKAKP